MLLYRITRGKKCIAAVLLHMAALLVIPSPQAEAAATPAPAPGEIRAVNRLAGTPDEVTVTGLLPGDVVKLYSDATSAAALGTASVPLGAAAASITVPQLGVDGGYAYVTLTRPGFSESRRMVKTFLPEPLTVPPSPVTISVTNAPEGSSDEITIKGLAPGDRAAAYLVKVGGSAAGQAVVPAGGDTARISIQQLGREGGVVYISVTEAGKRESRRTEKSYAGEAESRSPGLFDIQISNALSGTADSVVVKNLQPNDIVRIYDAEPSSIPIAVGVVEAGSTQTAVSMSQLGELNGRIYVSVTRPPLRESKRVGKLYAAEPDSMRLEPSHILILNAPSGTEDVIEVRNAEAGDVLKVYADQALSSLLGSQTVPEGGSGVTIRVAQLGAAAGKVYVTVTSPAKRESAPVAKLYDPESSTPPPARSQIQIRNRAAAADIITVSGLTPADTVKVYRDEKAAVPLASGSPQNDATSVQWELPQLGTDYGVLYFTVTGGSGKESPRVSKIYLPEQQTTAPSANRILVTNRADALDEVTVSGIVPGDRVRLYHGAAEANPFAEGYAAGAEGFVTFGELELMAQGGSLYVTVTSPDKKESRRIQKLYMQE